MSNLQEIKQFVLDEFLPDVPADELGVTEDLLAGGVIDSLGLLKVIAWLEDRFAVPIDDVELAPDSFRTIEAIDEFIRCALAPAGAS
ncbi:Phosphopantetheine attachment site [Actinokineospora alba]|uniref:Phosphopantetheine attachment site n=1 Tax=Actinokineospora alba TaxID=504798 RepID=A0A1H0R6Y6_9PSEU|nr:acyl carrier protein [Actinokineospora alba]TDP70223.1 phosphopantetheine binding protein [Actinokineospora alba]SDI36481.1 Phosphopantetheine attachment site [Actinokineospora alba]SDP25200.1 Phosphopantetheine attachment site [Actinokineospora alba]